MSGLETEIEGIKVCVEYDYEPYEPSDLEYPGCPASVEINSISLNRIDIFNIVDESIISQIERDILAGAL